MDKIERSETSETKADMESDTISVKKVSHPHWKWGHMNFSVF